MSEVIEILQNGNRVVFTPESNGVPAYISVMEFDCERIIAPCGFSLSMEVEHLGRITPCSLNCKVERYTQNGAEVVEFPDLHWMDDRGEK